MEHAEITRTDFPTSPDGYDRRAVDAHLTAVAAQVEALRARINALGVEIEALRSDDSLPSPTGTEGTPVEPAQPVPSSDRAVQTRERGGDAGDLSEDQVSARLAASRLHLDGLGRDEIVTELASSFRLDDPGSLVDEVIEGLS